MDFSTLVDLDDFFDDAITEAASESFFAGLADLDDYIPEEIKIPELPEMEPIPEFQPQEYKAPELEEVKVEQIRQEADTRLREGGQEGFMDWWRKLPEKQQQALFRSTMSAVGTGAQAALQTIQQRRGQEFQQEMQERQYQEREKERREAEEARRVAGTPRAYQFNVSRGLVGQNMGGG